MYRNHNLVMDQATLGAHSSEGIALSQAPTIADVLHERAAKAPHQTAFFILETSTSLVEISNGDLLAKAKEFSTQLKAYGLKRGEIVLLALETSADLITALFGCIVGGYVPSVVEAPAMGAALPQWFSRLAQRARHVRASLILTRAEFCEGLLAEGLNASYIEALPEVGDFQFVDILPSDPIFLQFTSGTTSTPKALQVKHQTLLSNTRGLIQAGGWTHQDVIVSWLPLYHDMGLVGMTLAGLDAGMPVMLMPPSLFLMNPTRWLWALHTFRGTISAAPNFAYQFVATRAPEHRTRGLDLSSWRHAINAAEFVQKSTIDQFTARFEPHGFVRNAFTPAYGLAEATVAVSIKKPFAPLVFDEISRHQLAEKGIASPVSVENAEALSVVCVGPVLAGHEVRIVDQGGQPLPDRIQGHITVKGPSVVGGYYDPDRTTPDTIAWLETGDLGYRHEGQLFITGRIKDLIIRAGANISPYEIEHTVSDIEGVRSGAVAAIGLMDPIKGTEAIVVLFETVQKEAASIEQTKQAIRDALIQRLNIAIDHVLDVSPHTLQKTTSGKLQRSKLINLAQERLP